MRGMARGYAAGDSRDRGGARLRGRWVCRLSDGRVVRGGLTPGQAYILSSRPSRGRQPRLVFSPNPPKDTDGRREGSGRGWVRELQGRWPGLLGPHRRWEGGGGSSVAAQGPDGRVRPYAGVAMRGMARGYAAGDSRDRGGARLRGRWVSCRLAVRPGTEWLAAGPRRD